jgi:hypothetical protein
MIQDNAVKCAAPGAFEDPLPEVLRTGARKLSAHAIEAERLGFVSAKVVLSESFRKAAA